MLYGGIMYKFQTWFYKKVKGKCHDYLVVST